MKVQKILPIAFKSENTTKPIQISKTSKADREKNSLKDDVFKKQEGRIMRRAAAFSLVMLIGAIAYFRKKF